MKSIRWRYLTVLLAAPLLMAADSCSGSNAADERATEQRMQEMRAQVGLPNVTNFTEAKFAKLVAELRDQEIATFTYTVDMSGQRHLLCESVGYGIPYSVQVTNPEQVAYSSVTLPQAEPNGLFMPDQADATWVLCSDGRGGVAPVYSEPHLLVSPFPLGHVDAAENSARTDSVRITRLRPSQTGT